MEMRSPAHQYRRLAIMDGASATSDVRRRVGASREPLLLVARLASHVGRNRAGIAVQIALEPVDLPQDALDEMFRLAGARQVVVLPREEHDFARHTEMLQRPEPLLALFNRDTIVVVRMEHER